MSAEHITETSIVIREATTRYMYIDCKNKETGEPFNFDGYTVQTYLSFPSRSQYVNTTLVENILSYKIPAEISLGTKSGVAETRIFKNGDVFEVLRVNISVIKAKKPDLLPAE